MGKKEDIRTIHLKLIEFQRFILQKIEEVKRWPALDHKKMVINLTQLWSALQQKIETYFVNETMPFGYEESKSNVLIIYNKGRTPDTSKLGDLNENLKRLITYIHQLIKT